MRKPKLLALHTAPGAIPPNCADAGDLPTAVQDLAELLAEIAMRRLQGPAPEFTGAQETLGDL